MMIDRDFTFVLPLKSERGEKMKFEKVFFFPNYIYFLFILCAS